MSNGWFDVDRKGLAASLGRRGKAAIGADELRKIAAIMGRVAAMMPMRMDRVR